MIAGWLRYVAMPDPAPIPLPAVLQGRYRIGPVIGHGGASVVYRAADTLLGRDVAIKAFTARAVSPEDLRTQEGEARLLGSLNHAGLVTLLDAGVDLSDATAPQVFLVMEFVQGHDLRARVRSGPLNPLELGYLGWDLCNALEYVHERGIVHRDLKPANVLLMENVPGRPPRGKLADFGIAVLRSASAPNEEFATGTAAYLSPEQVEGLELGTATDVYSLGLVLLEAATGRIAFPGGVVDSALARLDHDPEIPPSLGPSLAELLRGMTRRDPAARMTAADAAVGFRELLVEISGDARPKVADAESARLEAVRRYNLLDTPPDGAFDRVTGLAARIFDVPVALVSIVDADRIWFKSHHGVDVTEVERTRGLAMSGGLHEKTLVVEDIETDPRINPNQLLSNASGVRFYAGVPLITPDGHNVGSFAIIDWKPRTFTAAEVASLEDLAAIVLHEMELRLAARRVVLQHD
jgi:eukaryotic-like serine/threonine-protein kinase